MSSHKIVNDFIIMSSDLFLACYIIWHYAVAEMELNLP